MATATTTMRTETRAETKPIQRMMPRPWILRMLPVAMETSMAITLTGRGLLVEWGRQEGRRRT